MRIQASHTPVKLSVIVPARNEQGYILTTLKSVARAVRRLRVGTEVLVVDNNSRDKTASMIRKFVRSRANWRFVFCKKTGVSRALNTALRRARGEFVARIDVGVKFSQFYLQDLLKSFIHRQKKYSGKLALVGGKFRFEGEGEPYFSIACVLQNSAIAGFAQYREEEKRGIVLAETVNGGVYLKRALEEVGNFDERLLTNEDFELHYRLRKAGWALLVDYSQTIKYQVTQSFPQLWRQYFSYGAGKRFVLAKHPGSLQIRQLAAILILPFCVLCLPIFVLIILAMAIFIKAKHREAAYLNLVKAEVIIPLAWSCGFWLGTRARGVIS